MQSRNKRPKSYTLPLPPVLLLGSVLAATFLSLVYSGPLGFEVLRRYCLGHPVAIASVWLFSISLVALTLKWIFAAQQFGVTNKAASILQRLTVEADTIPEQKRSAWLLASWESQPLNVRQSWLGERVIRTIETQLRRGNAGQLDSDLRALSESDADRQHESYSLLRIIHWAMPMLGFLGTVLGISQTLGRLDTQLLATQQQDAMNQLTAGLYVAFDTTAIALILTVISMFMQFAINRAELNLLSRIDTEVANELVGFLRQEAAEANTHELLLPIQKMTTQMLESVQQVTEKQAEYWAAALAESQKGWVGWTARIADEMDQQFSEGVKQVVQEHLQSLESLQVSAESSFTEQQHLLEQSFERHTAELGLAREQAQSQMQTLNELAEHVMQLKQIESGIADSLNRADSVSKIEEASLCIGEAVAVMATSLERAGIVRGSPQRPRPTSQQSDEAKPGRAA